MRIDSNEMEKRAMDLFKEGKTQEAKALQEQFLREALNSGEDHCPCPASCKLHGKCVECVTVHRGHADHVPYCMREMINRQLEGLSALTEHSLNAKPWNE